MFTGHRAASGTDFIWKGVGDGKRPHLVTLYRPRNPGSHGRGFETGTATGYIYFTGRPQRSPLGSILSS